MIINTEINDKLVEEVLSLGYKTLDEAVEASLKLLIKHYPSKQPKNKNRAREGWEEALIKAGSQNDNEPILLDGITNEFDKTEWTWNDKEDKWA